MHTLLDEVLPRYDVHEVHQKLVPAPPDRTFRAVEAVTARELRAAAPLMALRRLPGLLRDRSSMRQPRTLPILEAFERGGFVRLREDPGREVVLGAGGALLAAQPGGRPDRRPGGVQGFCEPGYARVAFNLVVTPDGRSGSRVLTETRVVGTDAQGSRLFRRYWFLIRGGSGADPPQLAAAIRRRASEEQPALVH